MNNTKPVKKVVLSIGDASLKYTPSEDSNSLVDSSIAKEDLYKFEKDTNEDAAST